MAPLRRVGGGIWEGDPLRPSAAGQYIAILASANT